MESSHAGNMYTRRLIDDELDELMPELAAIAIEGSNTTRFLMRLLLV